MENLDITELAPLEVALRELANKWSSFTADPNNADEVATAKSARLELRTARTGVEKKAKSMREGALLFQKTIISREKELVSIITVEEERMQAFEDAAKDIITKQERLADLPRRQRLLGQIGEIATDESMLAMSDEEFAKFFAEHMDLKAQREEQLRMEREAEALRIAEAEQEAILSAQLEAGREEAEKRIREEERMRMEAETARRTAEQAIFAAEEKKKLEQMESYRDLKMSLGWNHDTMSEFKEEKVGEKFIIWKKVGEFKP